MTITKDNALDAISTIQSRLEAYEVKTFEDMSEEMVDALNTLEAYVEQSEKALEEAEDLEWDDGVSLVCWDRVQNDDDLKDEIIREKNEAYLRGEALPNEKDDDEFAAWLANLGLGRHYGVPHCIYCLQGQ